MRNHVPVRNPRAIIARFLIYGLAAMAAETFFHSIIQYLQFEQSWFSSLILFKWQVDPNLGVEALRKEGVGGGYAVVSKWMILVYGLASVAVIEPIWAWTSKKGYQWAVRGVFYAFFVAAYECIAGWILYGMTGYSIWVYTDSLAILQYTSVGILPIWFLVGVFIEPVMKRMVFVQEALAKEAQKESDTSRIMRAEGELRRDETVVIVHGLWLSSRWMRLLGRHLVREGYDVQLFDYATWNADTQTILTKLARTFRDTESCITHALVHSTGGLLVTKVLADHPDIRLGRVVALGTPFTGSRMANLASRMGLAFPFLGRQTELLMKPVANQDFKSQLGIISGVFPFGIAAPFFGRRGLNDGIVSLEETHHHSAKSQLHLSVSHIGLMFSTHVAEAAVSFFRYGVFHKEAQSSRSSSLKKSAA